MSTLISRIRRYPYNLNYEKYVKNSSLRKCNHKYDNMLSDNSLQKYLWNPILEYKYGFLRIDFLLVCISLSLSLSTNLCPHIFILLSWEHFLFDVNYYIHINPDPTAWPSVILSIFTWQRNMHIREYNTSKVKREM